MCKSDKMEEQSRGNPEAETITDIQNYLASFNKEIQDGSSAGTQQEGGAGAGPGDSQALSHNQSTPGTYYVTQASDGNHIENYSYAEQNQAQYSNAPTYYASGSAYYANSEQPSDAQQPTQVAAFPTMPPSNSSGEVGLRQVAAVSSDDHSGLRQIVLAVREAGGMSVDGEAQEISVTIPASMTSQVRHPHDNTEELLKAVQSHGNTGDSTGSPEQPTFVAMQPGSSHDNHVESAVPSDDHQRGLATLINQADSHGSSEESQQSSGRTHTIRMVLRQPDGTETEQTIPVSNSGGPTLVTSDGQEIHVSDEGTLQMMANLAEQAAASGATDAAGPVILNAANSYQTVTIVPSDTNPGEVSYVLIVSQSEDGKDQKDVNLDMSVYDFNEGERHGELVAEEVGPDGTKMRTIKITPKKSQIVTQAHMCNYCNYTSPKRYLLSRHMKSHSEERPHKCSVCERGFKTLASLQNHVNTHTGTRPHQCRECDASFTTSGELVRHVRYKHTHEKPHRCTECDYASVELSKLKRHMRCHTGERPYQCPHCTYASPDTYKLKRHLRIHTGEKPYECDVCQARFTQSNSLKAHKLIHSGNKPIFHCEYCPTTCGRKTDLRIHVQKLHTSDRPLKCKRCGKSFPDRYTYKIHSKTHEGEKCFKCDLCPYASISQRHLESHMLIHTDQKPFRCDECDQAFRQKQLLKRHKNLYHDPNYVPPIPKEKTHECPECGKAFRHKGNLIRHLAVHDPEASAAERAEAMRIGEPKAPGEQRDGEEDDYLDDDEDIDGLEMDESIDDASQEGQQVVVFEVIQLPTDGTAVDGQTLTVEDGTVAMAAANGDAQGVTIIQQVPTSASSIMDSVTEVHEEHHTQEVITSNSIIEELTTVLKTSQPSLVQLPQPPHTPRRRGRPRKYPLPTEITQTVTQNITISKVTNIEETSVEVMHQAKKPKLASGDEGVMEQQDIVYVSKPRRGRPAKNANRVRIVRQTAEGELLPEPEEPVSFIIQNPEELARREQELAQKRLEQKQKDMAECFGFNDDDDEDETILAMPAAPGLHVLHHQKSSDAEMHLLRALQQNGTMEEHAT